MEILFKIIFYGRFSKYLNQEQVEEQTFYIFDHALKTRGQKIDHIKCRKRNKKNN